MGMAKTHRARRRVAGALTVLLASSCGLLAASGVASGSSPGGTGHARATKGGPNSQLTAAPLVYHGGKLLSASKTYAIFWGPRGNFPSDLFSGMASLLGGFGGSRYLG